MQISMRLLNYVAYRGTHIHVGLSYCEGNQYFTAHTKNQYIATVACIVIYL